MKRVRKVICYVVRGTELLVFRQPAFPEAGLQVPAGTIEAGETPEDAAVREVWEETGLRGVEGVTLLGTYEFDMSAWKAEVHERWVFGMRCGEGAGEVRERWSHWEVRGIEFAFEWVGLGDGGPELIADQGRYLEELRGLMVGSGD